MHCPVFFFLFCPAVFLQSWPACLFAVLACCLFAGLGHNGKDHNSELWPQERSTQLASGSVHVSAAQHVQGMQVSLNTFRMHMHTSGCLSVSSDDSSCLLRARTAHDSGKSAQQQVSQFNSNQFVLRVPPRPSTPQSTRESRSCPLATQALALPSCEAPWCQD